MIPGLIRKCARGVVQCGWPLALLLLRLLRPLALVRIGRIRADRIGHLAANTEIFLRRLQLRRPAEPAFHVFVCGEPCNRQLLTMYKRRLFVIESPLLTKVVMIWEPWLSRTPFFEPLLFRSNEYDEFSLGRATLEFTPAEEARGRAALERMGVGPDDWFVCFHNRDSAYLGQAAPGRDWSYHDYRDCDIRNFLKAAEYVVSRGGFALRMGAAVAAPLPGGLHPRIIDYATSHRDDFLDIYLVAKCRFMIGSDTGLAQVATAFDVPVVNTNVPRIDWASFRAQDIFIQKRMFDEAQGRLLTYPEILARGHALFLKGSHLAENRLRLIENTAEEILDATREMDERAAGTFVAGPEDEELQRRYRALFGPERSCHGFRSRIGRDFLRANKGVILPAGAPAR